MKPDTAPPPLAILGRDILGNENNSGLSPDEFIFPGFGFGSDQRKQRAAVRGRDRQPPVTGLKPRIEGQIESEPVHVESQARILIPDINVNRVNTQVQAWLVELVRSRV